MSLVIFFGFSFFIFLCGLTAIGVTFYHWYKQAKQAKLDKKMAVSQN